MKKYKSVIIYSIIFITFMILAIYGYNYLKNNYQEKGENGLQNNISENLNRAPDFKAVNNNGEEVSLSEYFGKPIIVNFWETWCSPCKIELPEFNDAFLKYGDKIQFMMVNLTDAYKGDTQNVKKFVSNNDYKFPIYFDVNNSASTAYNIYSIPKTVFIDKNGNMVDVALGMLTGEELENYIKKLLK